MNLTKTATTQPDTTEPSAAPTHADVAMCVVYTMQALGVQAPTRVQHLETESSVEWGDDVHIVCEQVRRYGCDVVIVTVLEESWDWERVPTRKDPQFVYGAVVHRSFDEWLRETALPILAAHQCCLTLNK